VLSALHDAEIVHRDIKPSNILISRDGRLLVTDFGLACDRVPPGRSVRVKGLMGTPAYMAPEMFDGVISPRTDIYALGVTAYELLTGETPFESESQIRREGEARQLPREQLEKRNVPEALIDLIERMTNPNAMFRLKSARQVQQLLERASVLSRTPSENLFADLLTGVRPEKQR
jgi:eukaryotic-like serine/threonine-protein kinase